MDTSIVISQFSLLPDNLKQEVADFIAFLTQKNNLKTGKVSSFLNDSQLTPMAMAISEKVLHEDWDGENDAHWESFLKDEQK